jgi:hypothetical protein
MVLPTTGVHMSIRKEAYGNAIETIFEALRHLTDEERMWVFASIDQFYCIYCGKLHVNDPTDCPCKSLSTMV